MKKKLYNLIDKRVLKQEITESNPDRITLSFYKYHDIDHPELFRDHLYKSWESVGVFGRTYVATEGINAQISVPRKNWNAFLKTLDDTGFLTGVRLNTAIEDDGKSFYVLKIKVRPKIVADGLDDRAIDFNNRGEHLDAERFNNLTDQPDTVVVDMRNHYESEVGHFKGAICPDVDTFRESLPIISDLLEQKKDQNIVMYCTGGIRCEKASTYLKAKGYKNVFQLDGGIIEYARQVHAKGLENKFLGKNFVFDERMGERIEEHIISQCHQCGAPCDTHINCANDACHILFLQCEKCSETYNHCCSEKCCGFISLPEEEQKRRRKKEVFNGTRFGKRFRSKKYSGGLVKE